MSLALGSVCICSGALSKALTWGNFQRVKPGMSLSEVEALLGPGKKTPGEPATEDDTIIEGEDVYRWYANGFEVYVGVLDGRVRRKVVWYVDYP
ncbi:MAG: hypothetical protein AB7K24_05845 [Gemmataceae bacterium]